MSQVMLREPARVPRKPGVFMLLNKRRRVGYVAYTGDLQKRSHSLAHMLQHPKTHWALRDLPRHPAGEFLYAVVVEGVTENAANRIIETARAQLEAKSYRLVAGGRGAGLMVKFKGEQMTLVDAVAKAKCKAKYITVWRRLARGWTVDQAVGVDKPPVRWDPKETTARRRRAAARQEDRPASRG